MEHWEFLIQKKGDRSWLPLETPEVEVLEGRYRMVARSPRSNAPVEIRAIYQSSEEFPPKRRVQKRTARTNGEGLMAVIPFTRLKPGIWEFSCIDSPTSVHSVRIEVLPIEFDEDIPLHPTDAQWEAPEAQPTASTPEMAEDAVARSGETEAIASPTDEESDRNIAPVSASTEDADSSSQAPQMWEDAVATGEKKAAIASPTDEESNRYIAPVSASTEESELPPPPEPPENATPDQPEVTQSPESESGQGSTWGKLYAFPTHLTGQPVTLAGAASEAVVPMSGVAREHRETGDRNSDPPAEETSTEETPEVASANPIPSVASNRPPLPPLNLTLARETYMVKWGEAFELEGHIDLAGEGEEIALSGLELRVSLQNPQTGERLGQVEQPLANQITPMSFVCPVEIPAQSNTHLILGEVSLCAVAGEVVQTRSFTITADVQELLGAIASDFQEEQLLEGSPESRQKHNLEEIDASFDEIIDTIKKSQPLSFESAPKEFLPPQIVKPQARSLSPKPLDLPSFPRPQAQPSAPEKSAEADGSASQERPEETETGGMGERIESPPESEPKAGSEAIAPPQEAAETSAATPVEETMPGESEATPVDSAFESLNLEERFFSRLNALASDRELSEWLKINFSPQESPSDSEEIEEVARELDTLAEDSGEVLPAQEQAIAPEGEAQESMPIVQEPIDWEAQEIVVDDELSEVGSASGAIPTGADESVAQQFLLPENEPVPTPELYLPKGELTSGRSVKVAVRLPQIQPRIYVKLWLHDRQSRTILDGPHWLTEFWPTGMGDVEGTKELLVPYGSLEVQFEAIAVEVQTQRESHKVSVDRAISPPRPPNLPLGDF